jgi:hypothetical protein
MFTRLITFFLGLAWAWNGYAQALPYQSPYLRVQMASDQANFAVLAVDSLGKGKLDLNVVLPLKKADPTSTAVQRGNPVEYPAWAFEFHEQSFTIRSVYSAAIPSTPFVLSLDPILCHATLLGLFNDDGNIALPALLHFPDHGTLRITSGVEGLSLGYDALRGADNFVRVSFPAATAEQPSVEYKLEVVAIHPNFRNLANDSRYDGFRRDFLNIFQINPRLRVLANHAASDPCAFTVYMYSAMAIHMPPLADGLSAMDILRQTIDYYVNGGKAYGMALYNGDPQMPYDFLDTYPSLVMAAGDYVVASDNQAWLARNYPAIKAWANKMIEFDTDGDGLMEYPVSGNSGSWSAQLTVRPSNWWDTIGFGHKDAYANALAYQAFLKMAELARMAGEAEDARNYQGRADKLKQVYYRAFYNPETGVLAGWKSADGKLHDYYFLFVNGAAVTYGLLTREQGNQIWDRLLTKMAEVGYRRFDLGLPGNLIPIRREDYVTGEKRWGGPQLEDGTDGFQIYENGGATACYAYFTIQALRTLGRDEDADAILYPMMKAFEDGGFQGRGPNGMTYDWKAWDGTPWGYEGLLVDGYLTLLAAMPTEAKRSHPRAGR